MHVIDTILEGLEAVIDLVGVGVIAWGFVMAMMQLISMERHKIQGKTIIVEFLKLRCNLASYILLGMEFLIASDIIGSITRKEASLEDLLGLALIVLMRTVISYSLSKEMERVHKDMRPP